MLFYVLVESRTLTIEYLWKNHEEPLISELSEVKQVDSLRERESANAAKQAQREYYRNWRKKIPKKSKNTRNDFLKSWQRRALKIARPLLPVVRSEKATWRRD